MSLYRGLMTGLIMSTIVLALIACFFAIGRTLAGKTSYIAFVICFGLVSFSMFLYWFCLPKTEEQFIPDQLEYEPTNDQILAMNISEQQDFVKIARMKVGCKPDDWGNRAKIRACYLINEAYKSRGISDEPND